MGRLLYIFNLIWLVSPISYERQGIFKHYTMNDIRLKDYLYQSSYVKYDFNCAILCIINIYCFSFNTFPSVSRPGMKLCEQNLETIEGSGYYVYSKKGGEHYKKVSLFY